MSDLLLVEVLPQMPTCARPRKIVSCSRSILTPSKPEKLTHVASDSLFSTERHSDMVLYLTLAHSRNLWQTEREAGYVLGIVQCACRQG